MSNSERRQHVEQILQRRTTSVFPNTDDVVRRLSSNESLTIYWGIDPTGAQVHIGHTIPLLLLRELGELGHTIILLIGDFTARIGDPTDKGAARTALTAQEVQENMATYLEQVERILPRGSFTTAYNSEWLSLLSLEQVLTLMSKVTVQQMIQRDMFQERLKADKPIYLNEFLYPLMQGYDSVALRTDGEIGGNDQIFNMLVGRDLEKSLLQKDKFVVATKLLVDAATGKKMSKSEGTLIAITDPPQEIRRKVLDIDDQMIRTIFELCTTKDMEQVPEDPRKAKEDLAAELIRMYQGEEAVRAATEAVEIDGKGSLLQTLSAAGTITSMSAGKNLIKEGAIKLNGETVEKWDVALESGDTIQVGKGKFLKIK